MTARVRPGGRVARNRSAAQLVRQAATLPRTGQDPPEAGIPVDDKPNPFRDGTDDPVACLDKEHLQWQ